MNQAYKWLEILLSIPRSFFFCCKYFSLIDAMYIPILIHYKTRVISSGGKILVNSKKRILLGFGGSIGIDSRKSHLIIGNSSILEFEGNAHLAAGFVIRIDSGYLKIGDNFFANKNVSIFVSEKIEFGRDNLIGWNCNFRDSDGHCINNKNIVSQMIIGNNNWFAAYVDVLKGVSLKDNNVIAYRSLVTASISKNGAQSCSLLAGMPAKVVQSNISWSR